MFRLSRLVFALLSSLFLALSPAWAHDGHHGHGITIEQPWARQTGTRTMSAAVYLIIQNDSDELETLLDAHTDRAEMTEVHRSFEEDGIMRMEHVEEVPLAPGETMEFAPGGYHIMLMRLTEPLKEGDVFPMVLTFENQGEVTVYVEVTGMAGPKAD